MPRRGGVRIRSPLEIVTLFPCSVGGLLWEAKSSQWTLTVCVKSTLVLVDGGVAAPSEIQDPIFEDRPWDGEAGASLFGPADLVPLKPKVDILLSGHAYAPPGGAARRFSVRMRVGDFEKQLDIAGDQYWVQDASGLREGEPEPLLKLPIRYELAAQSDENPVGIRIDSMKLGARASANIESLQGAAGFGPYAPAWRARRALLSDESFLWAKALLSEEEGAGGPAPLDLDFRFFNAAPPDQQIELLRPGITIELENLHPHHSHLCSRLPLGKPQAFSIDAKSGRAEEIGLRCDTLWIHGDRGVAVLNYRGLCELSPEGLDAISALLLVSNSKGKRVRREQVERAWQSGNLSLLTGEADDPGKMETRYDEVLSKRIPGVAGEPEKAVLPSAVDKGEMSIGSETRRLAPGDDIRKNILPFSPNAKSSSPSSSDISIPRSRKLDLGKPITGETLRSAGQPLPAPATPFEANSSVFQKPVPPPVPAAVPVPPPAKPEKTLPARTGALEGTLRFSAEHASILKEVLPFQSKEPAAAPDAPAKAAAALSKPAVARPADKALPALPEKALKGAVTGETVRFDSKQVAKAVMPFVGDGSAEKKAPKAGEGSKPQAASSPAPLGKAIIPKAKVPAPAPVRKAIAKKDEKAAAPKNDPKTPDGKSASDFLITMPVERYAAIAAELAVRAEERALVLSEQGFTEDVWAAIEDGWSDRIAHAMEEGNSRFLETFDVAYIAALERFGRKVGVKEYAMILVGIERGEVGNVLLSLKLGLSDLVRVQRVWTKRMAADAELAARVEKEAERLRASI